MARNPHKAFCDIEQDIAAYYADRDRDLAATALAVACRALAAASALLEPADRPAFEQAHAVVLSQLARRHVELYRRQEGD